MTKLQKLPIAAAILVLLAYTPADAQQLYKNPEEAVGALAEAAKAGDIKGVEAILGPGSRDILASGDEVADRVISQA